MQVSIVIPAFNRTRFLALAVQSALNQTYSDWELIIADDGSDEETHRYLQSIASPNVRVVWLPHSGNPSRARNAGAAAARGRYLAFLDSDDEWAPHKLERQLAALRDQPQCRWSYTACRHIDESGCVIPKKRLTAPPAPEGWIFRQLLTLEIGIAMPTVVTERSLFTEAGGFDEQQLFGEFHDLCLRLALKSAVVVVREPLCSVRVHREHYSSDRVADHAGWLRLYQKMAATTDDPGLRAFCARKQADESLNVARAHADKGEYRAAWTTLGHALSFSWRYPQWWWAALKGSIRRLIPNALTAALRPRQSSK
jgi:glycosyltransferase involved in cell wall biosynthesis